MACECGGNRFAATQICRHDVVVDDHNNFIETIGDSDSSISDAEHPYGPYTCLKCETPYDELPDSAVQVEMCSGFQDHTWTTFFMDVPRAEFDAQTLLGEAQLDAWLVDYAQTNHLNEDVAFYTVYHIPEEED